MNPQYWFVFDVESIGLHGEGFAVGWSVIDASTGAEADHRLVYCPSEEADASAWEGMRPRAISRDWVASNIPDFASPALYYADPYQVRRVFWLHWLIWKGRGAVLAADVAWPVEARFLSACVDDAVDHLGRDWEGPYPLIDIASVRLAVGLDPLATVERLPSEMPPHDPRADARQSARLLFEALHLEARS